MEVHATATSGCHALRSLLPWVGCRRRVGTTPPGRRTIGRSARPRGGRGPAPTARHTSTAQHRPHCIARIGFLEERERGWGSLSPRRRPLYNVRWRRTLGVTRRLSSLDREAVAGLDSCSATAPRSRLDHERHVTPLRSPLPWVARRRRVGTTPPRLPPLSRIRIDFEQTETHSHTGAPPPPPLRASA